MRPRDSRVGSVPSASVPALLLTGLILAAALPATPAPAGVIFTDDFETLDPRWTKNINGSASIELVPGGVEGNCLRVTAEGGTGYLTTDLDPAKHGGTTIEIRAMVKLEDVKVGPQTYSTAKFHVGQTVEGVKGTQNAAARWLGTSDWVERSLKVDLDERASRIFLDLGIQGATGTAYFDNLVVSDTYGTGRPISLRDAANRGRSDGIAGDGRGSFLDTGMHDLFALPEGNLETDEVTFYIPRPGDNLGRTCAILRGTRLPDLPAETEPIPVGKKLAAVCFLQAAAWADLAARSPCVTYEIAYADGESVSVEVRAGVEIGNFDDPRDLESWKIVWRGEDALHKPVGVGMLKWTNPRPDVAVESLRIRSAGNAVPIILAVTYLSAARG